MSKSGKKWRPNVSPVIIEALEEFWLSQPDPGKSIVELWNQAFMIFDGVLNGVGESTRIVTLSINTDFKVFGGNFDVHGSKQEDPTGLSLYTTDMRQVWITGSSETFVPMIASGLVYGGSIIVRDFDPSGKDPYTGFPLKTVSAYALGNLEIGYLSEADIFDAFCTDSATGEPIPPEDGVTYIASPPLKL